MRIPSNIKIDYFLWNFFFFTFHLEFIKFSFVSEYGKLEVLYFNRWEGARREQNAMMCEQTENKYNRIIKEMTKKIKSEERVHREFEVYIEESRIVSSIYQSIIFGSPQKFNVLPIIML